MGARMGVGANAAAEDDAGEEVKVSEPTLAVCRVELALSPYPSKL